MVDNPTGTYSQKGTIRCTFQIESPRWFVHFADGVDAGTKTEERPVFSVETWGSLAVGCLRDVVKGRGVRLVGRLKQNEEGAVVICAEHVEYKPLMRKG